MPLPGGNSNIVMDRKKTQKWPDNIFSFKDSEKFSEICFLINPK